MSDDLESLLEDVEWQKEVAVRRYLMDLVEILETKLGERPDAASGRVPFNPGDLGGKRMSKKYGRVAKFLSEDADYVEEFTNYHIKPGKIQQLKEEAGNIELYPSTEQEEEYVKEILEGKKLEFEEIKDEFAERVDYQPTKTMIQQRLHMIEDVESEGSTYYFK